MDRGIVVSFDGERRRRQGIRRAGAMNLQADPQSVALGLCRELDNLSEGKNRWILIETLCRRTALSQQQVVGAAVYAHVHGWLISTPFSLFLREEGRTIVACSREYRQPAEQESPSLQDSLQRVAGVVMPKFGAHCPTPKRPQMRILRSTPRCQASH